jgi:hypothetical protein
MGDPKKQERTANDVRRQKGRSGYGGGGLANVTYFAFIVATLLKNRCRPSRAHLYLFTFSQGSAALHPGLTPGRASGALVHRSASDLLPQSK